MQGFNKYYPADYEPSQGSLNKVHGKHALGDRARKLDKGILIVRFELPFNIWCSHCENHIGQGVRYNAEKSKVGNYYTTPIWNFRCKCHLCQNWFEIRTDPQNTRYVVHSGARQQIQEWDPAENGGVVLDTNIADPEAIPDPFETLEKTQTQKKRALSASAQLEALYEDRDTAWSDPYAASSRLRSSFRSAKRLRLASEGKADQVRTKYALGDRVGVNDLATPAREEDRAAEDREWREAKVRQEEVRLEKKEKEKRSDREARPIFSRDRKISNKPDRESIEEKKKKGNISSAVSDLKNRLLLASTSSRSNLFSLKPDSSIARKSSIEGIKIFGKKKA